MIRSISHVTRPTRLEDNWREHRPANWASPPQDPASIAGLHVLPTGANLDALSFVAARILSTTEQPAVDLLDFGTFNYIFVLDFRSLGHKLTARIPSSEPDARARVVIPRTAATMAFAHYAWNIPSPRLLAWNDSPSDPVGAPYILAELVDDVAAAPWLHLSGDHPAGQYNVLDDMARLHARALRPLPTHLQAVGHLAFAEGAADPADPRSYTIAAWTCVLDDLSDAQRECVFSATSLDLKGLWTELWGYQHDLCVASDAKWSSSDEPIAEPVPAVPLMEVAELVKGFMVDTLESLYAHPSLLASCLALEDNAVHNTLFDRETLRVKGFIDWDNVSVLPLALSVRPPSEIMNYVPMGLPVDASWQADGAFYEVPPNGPGENPEPIYDERGIREDWTLIHYMALRERYMARLAQSDARLSDPVLERVRHDAMRVQTLLTGGGPAWWRRREWLKARTRAATTHCSGRKLEAEE